MSTMDIPRRFVKKVGKTWRLYSMKGEYDSNNELELSLRFGRKTTAKKEAEAYKNWQNSVNNAHAIVRKFGTVYVVYISREFRTQKDANEYSEMLDSGASSRDIKDWLNRQGYL